LGGFVSASKLQWLLTLKNGPGMNIPTGWNSKGHEQWQAGQRDMAIQTVFAAINVKPVPVSYPLGMQAAYYLSGVGNWRAAAGVLTEVCKTHPNEFEALLNLGICLSRAGQPEQSIATLKTVLSRNAATPVAWDSLASSCYRLGRFEEAREAGERSLLLKNAATRDSAAKDGQPMLGMQSKPQKQNIISFSLWGQNPRYLRGALRNAILTQDMYPGWRCRFHVDASVPEAFLEALRELGAQLLIETDVRKLNNRQRLMRRFLVANDREVGYFIVRDCDSVIGVREVNAVHAWMASQRAFHVMRDWWTHTDLMLAGMWGGVAGLLPDIDKLSSDYQSKFAETANWDQWFLRDRIWPLIRNDSLIHDRCFRVLDSLPLPGPEPDGTYHVGQDEFAVRRGAQEVFLAPWIDRLPCLRLPAGVENKET